MAFLLTINGTLTKMHYLVLFLSLVVFGCFLVGSSQAFLFENTLVYLSVNNGEMPQSILDEFCFVYLAIFVLVWEEDK